MQRKRKQTLIGLQAALNFFERGGDIYNAILYAIDKLSPRKKKVSRAKA